MSPSPDATASSASSTTSARVVVLAGGISHEREISLRSGRKVADALASHGLHVELRDPDATLLPALLADRPDVVWPALHGASGEDGALRSLLEFLGVPYVGSRAAATRSPSPRSRARKCSHSSRSGSVFGTLGIEMSPERVCHSPHVSARCSGPLS